MLASDYRKIARDNLSNNWGNAILAALVAFLLGGLVIGYVPNLRYLIDRNESLKHIWPLAVFAAYGSFYSVLTFVIGGVVKEGYCLFLLKQYNHEQGEINDLFSQFTRFGDGFLLNFFQTLFIVLWSLLLIVPGIIASLRYAMAPYILLENPGIRPMDALKASTNLMEGHKWELFCLHFSFIGWGVLSALTCGIGLLWLNPYINAAHTAFYRNITRPTAQQNTVDSL